MPGVIPVQGCCQGLWQAGLGCSFWRGDCDLRENMVVAKGGREVAETRSAHMQQDGQHLAQRLQLHLCSAFALSIPLVSVSKCPFKPCKHRHSVLYRTQSRLVSCMTWDHLIC